MRISLPPDVDVYAIAQAPGASYEVLVDMGSGDLGVAGPVLERFDTATSAVVQASTAIGVGYGRVLRWQNLSTAVVAGRQVRVRSGHVRPAGAGGTGRLADHQQRRAVWRAHRQVGRPRARDRPRVRQLPRAAAARAGG